MKRSCYKCTRRHVGCQATCPDFAREAAALQKNKANEKTETAVLGVYAGRYNAMKERMSKSGKRIKLNSFR